MSPAVSEVPTRGLARFAAESNMSQRPAPRVFGTTQLLTVLGSRGKVEVHDQQVLTVKAAAKLVIDSSSQSVNNGVRSHSTVAMIRSSGEPWGRSFVRWQLNSLGSLQT